MFAAFLSSEMLYAFLAASFWPVQGQNKQHGRSLQLRYTRLHTGACPARQYYVSSVLRCFVKPRTTIATVSGAQPQP